MAFFETIEAAAAFVWALPLGIGKLICTAGGFYVGIKGKHYLSDLKKLKENENNKTISDKTAE